VGRALGAGSVTMPLDVLDSHATTRHGRWRQRMVDTLRCGHCGHPMPDNDLRRVCPPCRRRHMALTHYKRYFLADFGIRPKSRAKVRR
jgi:rubrerythrin